MKLLSVAALGEDKLRKNLCLLVLFKSMKLVILLLLRGHVAVKSGGFSDKVSESVKSCLDTRGYQRLLSRRIADPVCRSYLVFLTNIRSG
jgi:hypothetical protein